MVMFNSIASRIRNGIKFTAYWKVVSFAPSRAKVSMQTPPDHAPHVSSMLVSRDLVLVERHLQLIKAGLLGDFWGAKCRSVDYCVLPRGSHTTTRLADTQKLSRALEKGDLGLFAAFLCCVFSPSHPTPAPHLLVGLLPAVASSLAGQQQAQDGPQEPLRTLRA